MALEDTLEQIKNLDLTDLDFDRIGVWPLPGRIFVCVLAVVLVFAGTYYIWVKGLNEQLERERAEETSLRQTFETKSFQAANLEQYREQMETIEERFGTLLSRLPSDTEVPGLLEDIDARGSESGLDINSIRLEQEQEAEYYIELPISINVSGGYHDMGSFVSGVAGMPRIVTLHNFTLTRSDGGSTLNMQIGAKTYRYKEQEGEQ